MHRRLPSVGRPYREADVSGPLHGLPHEEKGGSGLRSQDFAPDDAGAVRRRPAGKGEKGFGLFVASGVAGIGDDGEYSPGHEEPERLFHGP